VPVSAPSTPNAPGWNPPRTTGTRPVVREAAPLPPTVQQPGPPPIPPTPPPAPAPMLHPTPTPTTQAKRMATPARGQQAPSRPGSSDEDLALTTTAPMSQPSYDGPMSMGDGPSSLGDDPAFAKTAPKPRITPPAHRVPSPSELELGNIDDLEELPVKKSRTPLFVLFGGLALIGLVGGTWAARAKLFGSGDGRVSDQYLQGRNLFLLDTEESFQQASAQLEQAHGADQSNALVLAALGELDATWAGYLRDDAREIETKAGAAGEMATRTLRKNAQHYLDEAKRYTGDALALAPDAMEVNRAMAEFLRVDGAPLAEATRYLDRALAKKPADPESTYTRGALLFREGRMDEARSALEQANDLNVKATQKPLYRALFALGRLDAQTGKRDEAKRELTQLASLDPQHERARTLLASLEAAAPPPSPPPLVAVAPTGPIAPPPAAVAPTGATGATGKKPAVADDDEPVVGGDYNKLVAQADRLSENGRPDQARKLYERALGANPRGVEALTGLGYCDLDGERFMSALDHFKQALNVVPEYGEALIGLGEAYKVRGDKVHAVEYYRRYLKSQPGGPKASMAKKNLQDLEPHLPPPESTGEEKPQKTAVDKDDEPKKEKSELPKPPPASADEPPP
jgi:tetratricopeptide (TPR) repeat protein